METAITGILEALYSRRDTSGNCYWALRYTDVATGKTVQGTVSGGESNIHGILRHWNVPDDWDRSIRTELVPMGIREFSELTKDWERAGCRPEDLAAFIRARLMSATRQWTQEEQERINRRRCDPAWELATEEEMATMSDSEEIERKRELDEEPVDVD